ncbi:MAG: phospholipase D family protein [Actinomycetota bacterium]|nr:phospholipase D family protein [Actinomycetota bacterium]
MESRTRVPRSLQATALVMALLLCALTGSLTPAQAVPLRPERSVPTHAGPVNGYPTVSRKARHHTRSKAKAKAKAKAKPRAKPRAKAKPKPGWSPADSTIFNYPFGSWPDQFAIQRHILGAINGSPRGSSIRLTTFTFIDPKIARALVAARLRGVSVQLLVNRKNWRQSGPLHKMRRALGTSLHGHPRKSLARASYARLCTQSCRGVQGNLHSKIYLFSKVGHTRFVTMTGSANLTTFAAVGQWNHLDTIIGRRIYLFYLKIFDQMRLDRPVRNPFQVFGGAPLAIWVFPRPGTNSVNDPMTKVLDNISCRAPAHTGVAVPAPKKAKPTKKSKHARSSRSARAKSKKKRHKKSTHTAPRPFTRRTLIRIGMYAWFENRGNWLARAVRKKWNEGCDVRIIYAVFNGTSKRILFSPTGRGRIPMRRSVTTDYLGNVIDYNHSKYLAVSGMYAGKPREAVWTGSTNFTNLGLNSDDVTMMLRGRRVFTAYFRNFLRVWRSKTSKRPIPTPPLV